MTADLASRVRRVQAAMAGSAVDALVVSPGADLRYLTGYDAMPLERLTALLVPVEGDPVLVVPALEHAEAERSPAALAGMAIVTHDEIEDAYVVVAKTFDRVERLAVDDHMWANRVFAMQAAFPNAALRAAGPMLSDARLRKGPDEIASLRLAGAAIDRVHARMAEFLRIGSTERQVAATIADAILEEGHATVDFTIVGSGPNSASPHHGLSDRLIERRDLVVVDIGGSTSDGYCSDSTRTYIVGAEPDADVAAFYDVLLEAHRAQCDFARPGVSAEAVDRVGRGVIAEGGYGDYFIHRTGHGIGLETHEEPYIVEGNSRLLEQGMAFSIEPGIYLPGRHGARIEDIVVTTDDGIERLNVRPRQLSVMEG